MTVTVVSLFETWTHPRYSEKFKLYQTRVQKRLTYSLYVIMFGICKTVYI